LNILRDFSPVWPVTIILSWSVASDKNVIKKPEPFQSTLIWARLINQSCLNRLIQM